MNQQKKKNQTKQKKTIDRVAHANVSFLCDTCGTSMEHGCAELHLIYIVK